MLKLITILTVAISIGCSININLNFDPEKLEKAMDNFLDDIGYTKQNKKLPTLKLFSRTHDIKYKLLYILDIITLNNNISAAEEENELDKIKKRIKEIHISLAKYYDMQIIGEGLDGTIKIVTNKTIKDDKESKKLKTLISEQNGLRKKFYKEFAKENGRDSEEAINQVKDTFIKKTLERAKENKWCIEEKDENDNVNWNCPSNE